MTHPLTDEAMHEIQGFCSGYTNRFDEDDLRAAYDKGAADTLEQVIEWLKETKHNKYLYLWEHGAEMEKDELIADLKEAMRPQEGNND